MTTLNEKDTILSESKKPSKFKVEKYDVVKSSIELMTAVKESKGGQIRNIINDFFKKEIFDRDPAKRIPGKVSLYELMLNNLEILFINNIVSLDTNLPYTKKLHQKYSSVVVRSYKIKVLYLILSNTIRIFPSNNYLEDKCKDIRNELQKSQIVIDFTTPLHKNMNINIQSTLIRITILLQQIEREIKDIFLALLTRIFTPEIFPNVKEGMKNINVMVFVSELAPDYYYILQLYLGRINPTFFNEIQKKQWNNYVADLDIIFLFLKIKNINNIDGFTIFKDLIKNKTQFINHRFDNFKTMTSCRDNLFYNIISALNVWIPQLWFAVSLHVHCFNHDLNQVNK